MAPWQDPRRRGGEHASRNTSLYPTKHHPATPPITVLPDFSLETFVRNKTHTDCSQARRSEEGGESWESRRGEVGGRLRIGWANRCRGPPTRVHCRVAMRPGNVAQRMCRAEGGRRTGEWPAFVSEKSRAFLSQRPELPGERHAATVGPCAGLPSLSSPRDRPPNETGVRTR